jgi:hypothetical protein
MSWGKLRFRAVFGADARTRKMRFLVYIATQMLLNSTPPTPFCGTDHKVSENIVMEQRVNEILGP